MEYKEKFLYYNGSEALARVVQRDGGLRIPRDTQGQRRQGSEQPEFL